MAPPSGTNRSPSPSQPSGKSEVSDLKLQLRQLAGSRAPGSDDAKRELFKKVISYMTIGIDVSAAFSKMKDCRDEDPMIRGLALRSLCSLREANLVESLVGPLIAGLKDGNGYVRMVAAIGVAKLYHISPQTFLDSDFPAMLKALMLNDPDAQKKKKKNLKAAAAPAAGSARAHRRLARARVGSEPAAGHLTKHKKKKLFKGGAGS